MLFALVITAFLPGLVGSAENPPYVYAPDEGSLGKLSGFSSLSGYDAVRASLSRSPKYATIKKGPDAGKTAPVYAGVTGDESMAINGMEAALVADSGSFNEKLGTAKDWLGLLEQIATRDDAPLPPKMGSRLAAACVRGFAKFKPAKQVAAATAGVDLDTLSMPYPLVVAVLKEGKVIDKNTVHGQFKDGMRTLQQVMALRDPTENDVRRAANLANVLYPVAKILGAAFPEHAANLCAPAILKAEEDRVKNRDGVGSTAPVLASRWTKYVKTEDRKR